MTSSPEWCLDNVVARLREQQAEDGRAEAHVFLDAATDDVTAAAQLLVETASNGHGDLAEIGKVHRLARSFGVRASPELVAAIGRQPGVRAVLPAVIDDVYPKPTSLRPG